LTGGYQCANLKPLVGTGSAELAGVPKQEVRMNRLRTVILGVICAGMALGALAVWTAGGGKAQDRCPATSAAKCDGLLLKKLGI
jgi:hypothetical protein